MTTAPPTNADRIRAALASRPDPESLNLQPKSAYEALTRAKVDDLAAELAAIRSRVDTLIWAVVGAVVVGIVMQLLGGS